MEATAHWLRLRTLICFHDEDVNHTAQCLRTFCRVCQLLPQAALPQQPLHRCLLPGAASYLTFSSVTNPHEFAADGTAFLGTSGQNVDDVWKCGPRLAEPARPSARACGAVLLVS